jgi:hypothetical protein
MRLDAVTVSCKIFLNSVLWSSCKTWWRSMRMFILQKIGAEFGGRTLALGSALCLLWPAPQPAQAADAGANTSGATTLDADPHLVGWWKFDEMSGQSAADSSKQGHNGILEGGLSFETNSAPGRIGKALQFDGKKASVRVAGSKGITGTLPRTIAAWIKTPAGDGDVLRWGKNDPGQMWIFGHIRGRIGVTPRGGYYYMKAGTSDNAWHHVAVVVKEGSPPNLHDHVKVFRDGEVAEVDDIGLLDLYPIETGDELDVTIGRGFKGLIDDLRLYDRALSEDEVNALFKLNSNSR